ncbi:DUF1877 family protein [Promicromonospora sp. NPDC023805]|uniref:DUF1877 family protein n=1 Tax=Promicromonospora sp. NPDC023805 TaxID=3154696 RepID=UPI0033C2F1FA
MEFELMVHVDAGLLAGDKDVRDLAQRISYEMFDDTSELDARWRRDGDADARLFVRDEFWSGNLLLCGEVWPHADPESLPFLGGRFIEIDEGFGAMAMEPDLVRVTSEYLSSLDIDELRTRNAQHFNHDGLLSVAEQLALGTTTIESLRDFYALAVRDGKAVLKAAAAV